MQYFSINKESGKIIDLYTNVSLDANQLENNQINLDENNRLISSSGDITITTTYLYRYSSYFVGCSQTDGHSCIPYSTAMALWYLKNRGRMTISQSSVSTVGATLYSLMSAATTESGFTVGNSGVVSGIQTYASSYCSRSVTMSPYWTSGSTAPSFSTAKSEIDSKYPVVLMLKAGVLVSGYNHATTMVGYKVFTPTDSTASCAYYAIVRDPNGTNAPERTLLWNGGNIYGYYVITTY